ncbi:MAG: hypothetical protein EBY17_10180, partial [Acidobacteriia bacterium]|nr:hypothetical protein [Terriglobia bacterium]
TIVRNPWIRDLRNIPRFFQDAGTFSTLPQNRNYRPIVTTSLAIDYWLGNGLNPKWFHMSTLFWFGVQISLVALLFRRALGTTLPQVSADRAALWGAALFAVHPAAAETINYLIQRGDLYATLGVVAALLMYAHRKGRTAWYLLPAVVGILSKPPALIFPVLLFLWMLQVENLKPGQALRRSLPAFLVTAVAAGFVTGMVPKVSGPSFMIPAGPYIGAQPAVLLRYVGQFFLPARLSGDTDRVPFASALDPEAVAGVLFLALLGTGIVILHRRRELRVISFGLAWFLVASLPTSLFPLAELENDHRMFFPFVGLTLAATSAVALIPFGKIEYRTLRAVLPAGLGAVILTGLAWGTYERNKVWHTEESFWRDVTQKSPRNGRAHTEYGRALLSKGDVAGALTSLERADVLMPNYYAVETYLGLVWNDMGNQQEAERHYRRAVDLAPDLAEPRTAYADWLLKQNRLPEAITELSIALRWNPNAINTRYSLMYGFEKLGNMEGLRGAALETLALFPGDRTAQAVLESANARMKQAGNLGTTTSAEGLVNQTMRFALQGQWAQCIGAARSAIAISPGFAMAWNNLATCQNGLRHFTEALQAAQEALRLAPDLDLAKKNIAFAQAQGRVPDSGAK